MDIHDKLSAGVRRRWVLMAFAAWGAAWADGLPPLVGDGVEDDTAAIQARLDSGVSLVSLPPPAKHYLISRTLEIGSGQELRLGRFTEIRLAPKSNCHMIRNKGFADGQDRHVAIVGGIWNFDNASQFPNPWLAFSPDMLASPYSTTHTLPPTNEWPMISRNGGPGYDGMAMRFQNVRDFVMRDVVIRNPATFAVCLARSSYFLIDGVEFDFDHYNPRRANMDGVHLDGGCHHGKISNLRGACFDDLLALNSNDNGHSVGEGEPISDIDIDGIYSENCHSAVRLLSTGGPVRRISIRNIHGTFYRYAVGITHFFNTDRRGSFDTISIADCHVAKVAHPEDIGYDMPRMPVVFVDWKLDIGSLIVSNLTREETQSAVEPTIAIYPETRIGRLTVRDCQQVNRTSHSMTFIRNAGEIVEFFHERTRLVDAPGKNILYSTAPITGSPPS